MEEPVAEEATTTTRRVRRRSSGLVDDVVVPPSKKARAATESHQEAGTSHSAPPEPDRLTLLEERMSRQEGRTRELEERVTRAEERLHSVELILGILPPPVDPTDPVSDRCDDMEERISVIFFTLYL